MAVGSVVTAPSSNRILLSAGLVVSAALASMAVVVRAGTPSLVTGAAMIAFLTVCAALAVCERPTLTLGILTLYLGLADGYVKLRTGSQYATLGRDVLLYAVCLGMLTRALVRRNDMRLPPYAGLVIAYVLLVVVQMANPGNLGLGHALSALRPHIEFVPLFFIAYATIRTKSRLRGILVLLVVIGAANGVVSYVQFTLTPEQLSAWGPGYAEKIHGDAQLGGRVFYDNAGSGHVRPFGLGGDSGQGGFVGLLALPATIALISLAQNRWRWIALVLGFAVALAIITCQGRTVILGAMVTIITYVCLTVSARRLLPTLAGMAVAAGVVVAATSFAVDAGGSGAFDRVAQIAPSSLLKSADEQRGSSVTLAPRYAVELPFGAGLGSVGPAASPYSMLNGETEFNFLLVELGVAGAIALLALLGAFIRQALGGIRAIWDSDLRAMLAALAAPLLGMVVMFFGSVITSASPGAPYLWGVGGILAYWLGSPEARRALASPARSR
jgi:hypothetical protein